MPIFVLFVFKIKRMYLWRVGVSVSGHDFGMPEVLLEPNQTKGKLKTDQFSR